MKALLSAAALAALLFGWLVVTPPPTPTSAPRPEPETTASLAPGPNVVAATRAPAEPGEGVRAIRIVYPALSASDP